MSRDGRQLKIITGKMSSINSHLNANKAEEGDPRNTLARGQKLIRRALLLNQVLTYDRDRSGSGQCQLN